MLIRINTTTTRFIVGVVLMGVALCVRLLVDDAIVLLIGDCYAYSARTNYPRLHCVVCDRTPPLMDYERCHETPHRPHTYSVGVSAIYSCRISSILQQSACMDKPKCSVWLMSPPTPPTIISSLCRSEAYQRRPLITVLSPSFHLSLEDYQAI